MHRRLAAAVALTAGLAWGCSPISRGLAVERGARPSGFRWIDPILDCQSADRPPELKHFEHRLELLAGRLVGDKTVSHLSIYFRDLRNGPWFGVNEDESFLPASLLKAPMMVAVLEAASKQPSLLAETMTVPPDLAEPVEPTVRPSVPLVVGSTYTVDQLLSQMIRRSDNAAMALLVRRVGVEGIRRLYDELGVLTPDDGVPDFLTVRNYASIFRVLFNASYLDRRSSERALDELTKTEFLDGLVRPLPKSVPVAHKFGERRLEERGEQQLHDCGIVYYPQAPYILCVMSRGADLGRLEGAIQLVSKTVFDEVSLQSPAKF